MADRPHHDTRTRPTVRPITGPAGGAGWQPPEHEVEPAYQPVQINRADGSWTVGRINGWWRPSVGERAWCRVRAMGRGEAPTWVPFDPERLLLLPACGT
ncbi:hypothetical protein OG196_03655 [Kitasatospora purpeofusca]|uniref:hypothetical protein n=1 Tax=Kitasatospora purpeofusca TaxID=67352 RepID=UPI002E0D4D46|nr:hypothetical protein OG196_03655 [Kitasatospora purpeofusca]